MEQGFKKFAPLVLILALAVVGVVRVLAMRQRKPRSFREDPLGAIKDRSELIAGRAQDATDEMVNRMQDSLDELRSRLPEVSRKRTDKRRAELNKRLVSLNDQVQSLVKDLRANSPLNR